MGKKIDNLWSLKSIMVLSAIFLGTAGMMFLIAKTLEDSKFGFWAMGLMLVCGGILWLCRKK